MALQIKEKYDPISTLISFQHQKNHYKHIINPRKTSINVWNAAEQPHNRKSFSYLQSKYQKNLQKQRKQRNKQIFKGIQKINTKQKGILEKAQEQFRAYSRESQEKPRRSLVNRFKVNQQIQRIKNQNNFLHRKIDLLRPLVGEKKEWKRHEKFSEEMRSKLKSKSIIIQQKFTASDIMKLVIQNEKPKKAGGELKMYQTLNLRNKFMKGSCEKQPQTARNKRRKLKKGQTILSEQSQSLNEQQKHNELNDKNIHKIQSIMLPQLTEKMYNLSSKSILLKE